MVCVTELHRFALLCIRSLFLCLIPWFRPFAMWIQGSKEWVVWCQLIFLNRGTRLQQSNSTVDSLVNVESPSQSANPFASPLDPSVNISSPRHRFHYAKPFQSGSQQDTYSTYLFTHCQKFNKSIKNPADYDVSWSLSGYLKHFERCSVANGEAALLLAARLREEAQKVLNGMSDSDCRNYAKIVDKLEVRCGVEKHCDLH